MEMNWTICLCPTSLKCNWTFYPPRLLLILYKKLLFWYFELEEFHILKIKSRHDVLWCSMYLFSVSVSVMFLPYAILGVLSLFVFFVHIQFWVPVTG